VSRDSPTIRKAEGARWTNRTLRRLLDLNNVAIDKLDAHHALLDFPFLDIFTTNQDLVIEASLANLRVAYTPIRTMRDLVAAKPLATRRIVKFHGDLETPDEIVFTRKDFKRRLRSATSRDAYLAGRLIEHGVLFIGYAVRDPNVVLAWERIRRHASPDGPPVAFRLLVEQSSDEVERMRELGIETVIVPIAD